MSIRNILTLTLLISCSTFNSIQGEIIRGVDVPRLDVSKLVGTWYLLTREDMDELLACSTSVVIKTSDDSYSSNVTYAFKPEAKIKLPGIASGSVSFTYTYELQKDSSLIIGTNSEGDQRAMVIFDIDYDSHMVIYVTNSVAEIFSGNSGFIFILGRQKTLPSGIIDKVKQSNFYQQGVKSDFELLTFDTSGCL